MFCSIFTLLFNISLTVFWHLKIERGGMSLCLLPRTSEMWVKKGQGCRISGWRPPWVIEDYHCPFPGSGLPPPEPHELWSSTRVQCLHFKCKYLWSGLYVFFSKMCHLYSKIHSRVFTVQKAEISKPCFMMLNQGR